MSSRSPAGLLQRREDQRRPAGGAEREAPPYIDHQSAGWFFYWREGGKRRSKKRDKRQKQILETQTKNLSLAAYFLYLCSQYIAAEERGKRFWGHTHACSWQAGFLSSFLLVTTRSASCMLCCCVHFIALSLFCCDSLCVTK